MPDIYVNLTYDEYKTLEQQCTAFKETIHGKDTLWYHKSFRLKVGDTVWEFHAPAVKARVEGELPPGIITQEEFWDRFCPPLP